MKSVQPNCIRAYLSRIKDFGLTQLTRSSTFVTSNRSISYSVHSTCHLSVDRPSSQSFPEQRFERPHLHHGTWPSPGLLQSILQPGGIAVVFVTGTQRSRSFRPPAESGLDVGFHLSPFLHLVSQSSSRYLCL